MRALATLWMAALLLAACSTVRSGVVWTTDPWARTVTIGDETYRVTADTQLRGAHGERIVLEQVPVVGDPGIGVRHLGRAEVGFRAREGVLESLWVRH